MTRYVYHPQTEFFELEFMKEMCVDKQDGGPDVRVVRDVPFSFSESAG